MAARNGTAYREGLRRQTGKRVFLSGRQVEDVVTDPALARPVASIADLYDLQCDPARRADMTFRVDSEDFGLSFLIPRTSEDLARRRGAMACWAEASFGMVGRSPDYCNSVLMSFVESEFFKRVGADFHRNVTRYYDHVAQNDLFLTHALNNPQTDRSKTSAQLDNPFTHLGIVSETADGLTVRGAKILATHGPTAEELIVYPPPMSLAPGDEKHALAFAIPTDTPGLRFICREPFDDGSLSVWDHPLGARFEEPDATVIFDDVLIPWERVFLHGNVALGNALFADGSIQAHTGHQTAVRGLVKCRFVAAVAVALARLLKIDGFLHVQEKLGELLSYVQLIEGALHLSELRAEPTERGAIRPAWAPLQSLRYQIPRFYERMLQVTQTLGSSAILSNPMESDLHGQVGTDIETYFVGTGIAARDRIHLSKLVWDVTGTQFAQRMLQYERYYAGDPLRVAAAIYLRHDKAAVDAQIARALTGATPR
jgi:4-hydroxyphenylacetate 3-monooxygenase oxygenase component